MEKISIDPRFDYSKVIAVKLLKLTRRFRAWREKVKGALNIRSMVPISLSYLMYSDSRYAARVLAGRCSAG